MHIQQAGSADWSIMSIGSRAEIEFKIFAQEPRSTPHIASYIIFLNVLERISEVCSRFALKQTQIHVRDFANLGLVAKLYFRKHNCEWRRSTSNANWNIDLIFRNNPVLLPPVARIKLTPAWNKRHCQVLCLLCSNSQTFASSDLTCTFICEIKQRDHVCFKYV